MSAAFLQGSQPLICAKDWAYWVPQDSVARLRKSCYGLVQAPYEWYESVRTKFLALGFTQSLADPCCWFLNKNGSVRAIVSGHVDDFIFVGSPKDDLWMSVKREIQEAFRWGEFEENKFTQCGVQVERLENGSFHLSQERYMHHTLPVPLSNERRKQRKEPTTDWEKTNMRGVLGAMSWHCSQVCFRYSAYVSLLLSEVCCSTVETIAQTKRCFQGTLEDISHPR